MKWFGESWGAPTCDPEDHTPTPVGDSCIECKEAIRDGDTGFVVPSTTCQVFYHRLCFLRTVIPCDLWTDEMKADMPEWWRQHRRDYHPGLA